MAEASDDTDRQKRHKEEEYYCQLYDELGDGDGTGPSQHAGNTIKRQTYWSWERFHMSVAFLSAKRSIDPHTQVGACIVNPEKKIVGVGHNALPESERGNQDKFEYWESRDMKSGISFKETKYAYVCHAAINAILNRNAESVKGCTIYTTLFPGHEDAKLIIQAGIERVVFYEDKYPKQEFTLVAKDLFDKAGVKYTPYNCKHPPNTTSPVMCTVFPFPSSSMKGKKCPVREPLVADTPTGLLDQDFFMAVACIAAQQSKDPNRQVGACIIDKYNKIVGVGYNGLPQRISDDEMILDDKSDKQPSQRKQPYVVHAEVNAIMYKTCIELEDCTLYTTMFPCNECAKVIIQSGIKKIYYLMDDNHKKLYAEASEYLLKSVAGYQVIREYDEVPQDGKPVCQCYLPTRKCEIPNLEEKDTACVLL